MSYLSSNVIKRFLHPYIKLLLCEIRLKLFFTHLSYLPSNFDTVLFKFLNLSIDLLFKNYSFLNFRLLNNQINQALAIFIVYFYLVVIAFWFFVINCSFFVSRWVLNDLRHWYLIIWFFLFTENLIFFNKWFKLQNLLKWFYLWGW